VSPHDRHFWRRILCVLAVSIASVVIITNPASAHAELLSTTPSYGADVARSPKSIQLVFNEGVKPVAGGLRLVREDSTQITSGTPRLIDNGFEVSVPPLEPGAYVFGWRVVSDDGHPLRGAFTFRVGNSGDQNAAASLAQTLLGGSTRNPATTSVYNVVRVLRLLATFLAIGIAAFFLKLRGAVFTVDRFRRLVMLCGIVGVIAELANVSLYGPFVSGRTVSAITDGVLLDDTLHDPVGRVAGLRIAVFVSMFLFSSRRPSGKPLHRILAAIGALTVSFTQLFPGHGTIGRWAPAATLSSVGHVLAAGTWLGSLVVLGAALLRSERLDRLRSSNTFSSLATVALAALLFTGAFASIRQVGTIRALTSTSFGKVLMAKLALVALVLLLGLRNRRRLPTMIDRAATGSIDDFRRSVLRESWLSLTIVIASVLLSSLEPARIAVRQPVSATIETESLLVDLTVEPAGRRGTHEIHLYALKPTGLPEPVSAISAVASLPEKGIERLPLKLVRAGSNHFEILQADLAIPGNWRFEVTVNVDDFSEVTGSTRVNVR
jgi:copper transport protein